MTNAKLAACGIFATLALAGCSTAPPRDGTSYDKIASELKDAAENRAAREQQQSVLQSLLPPLSVEMPKTSPLDLEQRFDLTVTNAPAPQVLNAVVAGTRYSMVVHPAIKEPISLSLKQVTLMDVLNTVREIYGYEYRIDGSLIYVLPASLQTRMYKVDYLTSLRRGSTDMRVSSNAITTPGASTATATPGAPSAGTSTQSTQVGTVSSSDFWEELRRTVAALAGCRVEARVVGGVTREDTLCEPGRQVVVSPQSGTVLVRAMPEEQKSIAAYLRSSQIAVEKQVLIEAKILEVTLKDGYETGINWAGFFTRAGETYGIGQLAPGTRLGTTGSGVQLEGGSPTTGVFPTPLSAGVPGAANLGSGGRAMRSAADAVGSIFGIALQTRNFAALMSFLDTQGVVHTLSSPRIATMNNQKAVLKVGADALFVTKITGGSVQAAITAGTAPTISSPTFDVQSFFSGIALDVTPRIADDGSIVLHVRPSVSLVNQNLSTFNLGALGTFTIPLVSNTISETDSVIRAQDGQIVAIGGLMRHVQTETRQQIPGFGDIPYAGAAFRNTSQSSEKRELVILLKPTAIHGDETWARHIGETRDRVQNMNRGFSWGGRSEVFGTEAEGQRTR